MESLTFTPLVADPSRSTSLLPEAYLNDMYALGKTELESALDVNVLGQYREVSNPAPNKWFGSEMFLATHLSKIMERATNCEILDNRYLEALEKVKKSTKAPCWLRNRESHNNQLYALLMHDAHKRMMKRFMSLPLSNQSVRDIISACQFQRGYLGGLGSRTEHTLLYWAQMERNHTVNDMFWSERALRRMHSTLYTQNFLTFLRRGQFPSHIYRNFRVRDELSERYTFPQVVRRSKWNENLSNRLERLGIETHRRPTNTMSGWREASDLREWSYAESNEERASNNNVTNVTFTMEQTDSDTRQSEDRIHRSNVTREEMMEAVQAPGEPTMLEHAAELARAATPALDEFTEACRNFTRQVGRASSITEEPLQNNESVQNIERLRRDYEGELVQEMRTARPENEEVVMTPSPAYHRYIDAIQNHPFNMDGTMSGRSPVRMTREQIDAQTPSTPNWIHMGAEAYASIRGEPSDSGDESSNMDDVDLDAVDDVCRRAEEVRRERVDLRDRIELNAEVARLRTLEEAERERERERTRLTERNRVLAEEWLGPDNLNNRGTPDDW